MKPTSPLSLLLFIHLHQTSTSASPVPTIPFPTDCHQTSCSAFRALLLSSRPNTPPTRLSLTQSPSASRQLSSPDTLDYHKPFDNRPYTPSKDTPPGIALSSDRPLSSSFLRSLTNANPASSPTIQKPPQNEESRTQEREHAVTHVAQNPLAAKPTSALPQLRKEDAKLYWASLRSGTGNSNGNGLAGLKEAEAQAHRVLDTVTPRHGVHICGIWQDFAPDYITFQGGVRLARDYSDVMVVGIVMLFLVAVVALEIGDRIGDISALFTRRRRSGMRRGQIYLADDETVAFSGKKPLSLYADPLVLNQTSSTNTLAGSEKEKEEEKEGFCYKSDAVENV